MINSKYCFHIFLLTIAACFQYQLNAEDSQLATFNKASIITGSNLLSYSNYLFLQNKTVLGEVSNFCNTYNDFPSKCLSLLNTSNAQDVEKKYIDFLYKCHHESAHKYIYQAYKPLIMIPYSNYSHANGYNRFKNILQQDIVTNQFIYDIIHGKNYIEVKYYRKIETIYKEIQPTRYFYYKKIISDPYEYLRELTNMMNPTNISFNQLIDIRDKYTNKYKEYNQTNYLLVFNYNEIIHEIDLTIDNQILKIVGYRNYPLRSSMKIKIISAEQAGGADK